MKGESVLYLAIGGVVGGLLGWFITRKYYKAEVNEVRETYREMEKKTSIYETSEETEKEYLLSHNGFYQAYLKCSESVFLRAVTFSFYYLSFIFLPT